MRAVRCASVPVRSGLCGHRERLAEATALAVGSLGTRTPGAHRGTLGRAEMDGLGLLEPAEGAPRGHGSRKGSSHISVL